MMTFRCLISLIIILLLISCQSQVTEKANFDKKGKKDVSEISLDINEANRLANLPLACIQHELPYKSGLTIAKEGDLAMPKEHHPAFYGCFDWHSAVHGHWSLVYLLKAFPELEKKDEAISMLMQNLTAENIGKEVAYFSMNDLTKSFERTYGWAWIFKLQEELLTWENEVAIQLYNNLQPLADHLVKSYKDYLPKLVYPIRVGEHSNTAFGLSFAYDYAIAVDDKAFAKIIKESALRFYINDKNCPISWEPSGYDFLSPCLQEIDIMRKVLSDSEFDKWSYSFLPELFNNSLDLEPGKVVDRSDGKLVHLDGLNFSRAWCLYSLRENDFAHSIANEHLEYSLSKIADGDYAGQHWLASFALYAFKSKK